MEGKIVYVNLSDKSVTVRSIEEEILREYLGGSGLAIRILSEEFDNSLDPFHPESPLVVIPGLLTGTPVPTACKTSFCAKAPQTGIWGEATVGGYWGAELKSASYDGIVITGKAEKPVYLWINNDAVNVESAEDIWGLDTYTTANKLLEKVDSKARVACIGQAGKTSAKWHLLSLMERIVEQQQGVAWGQ